mgnify:CR=1 FL=1
MLNNRGWGTKDVMMIVCVMFVAVLVTMFTYDKNFKTLFEGEEEKESLPEKSYNYHKLEESLETSAKEYYSANFDIEKVGEIPLMTITSKTLIEKEYLDSLETNNEMCTGYVNIKNNEGSLSYDSYIKCDSYQTEGYTANLNKQ